MVVIGWQAKLLRVTHALLPGLTARMLALANLVMPSERGGPDEQVPVEGMHLATRLVPSWLTGLLDRAARRNLEYAGRGEPAPEHARGAGLPGG